MRLRIPRRTLCIIVLAMTAPVAACSSGGPSTQAGAKPNGAKSSGRQNASGGGTKTLPSSCDAISADAGTDLGVTIGGVKQTTPKGAQYNLNCTLTVSGQSPDAAVTVAIVVDPNEDAAKTYYQAASTDGPDVQALTDFGDEGQILTSKGHVEELVVRGDNEVVVLQPPDNSSITADKWKALAEDLLGGS